MASQAEFGGGSVLVQEHDAGVQDCDPLTSEQEATDIATIERKKWGELGGLEPPDRSEEYYSCGYIEGGMVLFPRRITACCVAHSDGLRGEPTLANFSGGEVPIAEMLKTRKQMMDIHQSGGFHDQCQGCPHLVKQKWGKKDYLIDMITIAHFTHCNIKCTYCYTVKSPELTIRPKDVYNLVPVFESMIRDKILAPNAVIRFSGGEPTMLKEFEQLIEMVSAYGARIIVYTNAVLFSPAIIRGLERRRVELVLGIDAGSPEVYRTVKGTNDCEAVWKNTAAYAAVDPASAWAKMIVRYDNYMDVDKFVERCEIAKVRRVFYDCDADAWAYPEHLPAVVDAIAKLKYEAEKRGWVTQCAEAGSQNIADRELMTRMERRYRDLAEAEDVGRALLFRTQLAETVGVDFSLYEAAAEQLGVGYALAMRKQAAAGYQPDAR
jgi:pyruvate-formate lyase-activating enzyme